MNAYDLVQLSSNEQFEIDKRKQLEFMDALHKWVYESTCDDKCRQIIKNNIRDKQEITVYRGHGSEPDFINSNVHWFTTSKSKDVAKREFANAECCLFTIHVQIDVPILDVYKYIPKTKFGYEDEVIVAGGGVFYNSEKMNTIGFKNLGNGEYETWYTFLNPKKIDIDRILAIIPKEEYEFIDSPDDIIMDIPHEMKEKLFRIIKDA